MGPLFSLKNAPCLSKSHKNALDLLLNFKDLRMRHKYVKFIHEKLLAMVKILDVLMIFGALTVEIYFILDLSRDSGYEALSFRNTVILSIISGLIILFFILLSLYLHIYKQIYSDLLLFAINIFSIVVLFEINVNSPTLYADPKLYFSYSNRFGLMSIIFVMCYKSWYFKVYQIAFQAIYFQLRMSFTDPITVVYNCILSIFCCFFFYFLEKHDKLAFQKMNESEKQNRSWKKILNTFPEGIAICSEDRSLLFVNSSMKQVLNEHDEENMKKKLFFQIKQRGRGISLCKNDSSDSANSFANNQKQKETLFNEIFQNFTTRINHHSFEKIERFRTVSANSFKQIGLKKEISMTGMKTNERKKIESFVTELNDKFIEVKLSTFNYESLAKTYIIILSDVTENYKIRILEDNQAFKNSLFASFTHEFRTPLNALFLLTKTLLLQNDVPLEIKNEIINPIAYNAEILHHLINTVADFVAINMKTFKLYKSSFNLHELLKETVRVLCCLAHARNLNIDLKISESLPQKIFSDENRIKQILFQFYSNALKFTTAGTIKISAKVYKHSTDRIQISVIDTGIGMNEKDVAKLHYDINQKIDYINYEQITGSAGAALGLTISNQIAKKLDKKPSQGIMFKSELGKGSKFYFTIKNLQNSNKLSYLNLLKNYSNGSRQPNSMILEAKEKTPNILDNPIKKNYSMNSFDYHEFEENKSQFKEIYLFPEAKLLETSNINHINIQQKDEVVCTHEPILVVDDDEFNIMALKMLLKMKGISCMEARNGKIALEIVETQCKERESCCKGFKLILMDLNMPVMNGIEASKKLNQSFNEGKLPWMPIVMCTAYGRDHNELGEKFDSGIVEVIHKPLNFEVLAKVLKNWLKN